MHYALGEYLQEQCFIKVYAMIESNRRKMERFDLKLPAELFWTGKDNEQESMKLMTSNVCAGGAYLNTKNPLPKETPVKLNITLQFDRLHKSGPRLSIIDVLGYVVRTDHQGMAICFNRNYKIFPYDVV